MKCPSYNSIEKSSTDVAAQDSKFHHLKASPVKLEPIPIKPQWQHGKPTSVLFSANNNTKAVHNKENSSNSEHDGVMDDGFEDSGYLSLQNSQIEEHQGDDEGDSIQEKTIPLQPSAAGTHQEKTISPKSSPSKCQRRIDFRHPASLVAASPSVCRDRRTTAYSLSSTPSDNHKNLPILKFQQAVCEELSKSYRKNKRYDWSIVTKVAEDHLLDRVIGAHMGLEHVDMFSSLLSRNMRSILTDILSLLGDMDIISCKRVSKTWRRIISEDTAALNMCQRAEQALRESRLCSKQQASGLTRDLAVSRVVLSCMQTLASSNGPITSSSSSLSCTANSRLSKRTTAPQKGSKSNSQCTRFNEYMEAARSLQQHESLRSCRRCGSPATHSPEVQRATCTRPSCLFDFCTHCQGAFHGSTPCREVQHRPQPSSSKSFSLISGSTRSKRSIRRL